MISVVVFAGDRFVESYSFATEYRDPELYREKVGYLYDRSNPRVLMGEWAKKGFCWVADFGHASEDEKRHWLRAEEGYRDYLSRNAKPQQNTPREQISP